MDQQYRSLLITLNARISEGSNRLYLQLSRSSMPSHTQLREERGGDVTSCFSTFGDMRMWG